MTDQELSESKAKVATLSASHEKFKETMLKVMEPVEEIRRKLDDLANQMSGLTGQQMLLRAQHQEAESNFNKLGAKKRDVEAEMRQLSAAIEAEEGRRNKEAAAKAAADKAAKTPEKPK
jgi:chromosome segregation ATPase